MNKYKANRIKDDPFGRYSEVRSKETGFKVDPVQWLRDVSTKEEYKFHGFEPGGIYFYKYQPKYKDTLAFYDRRPLGIFLKKHADGKTFYLLNLHFLPMRFREKVFRQYKYATGGDFNVINSSIWSSLSTIQQFFPFIIRRYLYTHIQEKIYQIPNRLADVNNVKLFPTEYFFKLNSNQIFELALRSRR